jgi:ribonuclease E
LLFQAPEPSAAPRRRATSAAGTPGKTTAKAERVAAQPPAPGKGEQPDEEAQVALPEATAEESEAAERAAEAVEQEGGRRRSRRRGGRGRRSRANGETEAVETAVDEGAEAAEAAPPSGGTGPDTAREAGAEEAAESPSSRRRRRRRRGAGAGEVEDPPGTVTKVREPRKEREEPAGVKGSTRLEAKKQRRREGREAGRRRTIITEAEFLARRESVERVMVVRNRDGRTQIGVLEDGVLVEHYVSRETNASMAGNVYLGRVQNVLPSMEAAFVDIGKGRNAVLYAGEVNWDAAGLEINQPKRIENALKSGDTVLVQVTKDPIGHKGARLTSQISLPGRYLVYVPEGSMTGISRKLPDTERTRLKGILKEVVPDSAGVIVRTAAEGASEEELRADVERLTKAWQRITDRAEAKSGKKGSAGGAPVLLHGEPDLTVRVIRDVFNEDFTSLVVAGDAAWGEINEYVEDVAPDLGKKLQKWTSREDLFTHYRVDEQLAKAMDRKVWLPSGGSLVIDRTEAMTVVDVNTGKFVGSGGNLEETVTKNNLEAAEEIVRQLRLRDIGGIIVIDFIDMVLESNRDLVVRRLLECLGRDRTKHQVAEVTSLGLVQMTRKRVGSGLIEVFSEVCEQCNGRGIIVHAEPVDKPPAEQGNGGGNGSRSRGRRGKAAGPEVEALVRPSGPTPAQIAAAAHAAAIKGLSGEPQDDDVAELAIQDAPVDLVREIDDDEEDLVAVRLDEAEEAERAEATEVITSAEPSRGAEPLAEAEKPSPAPRKRKRGRVVAPAGPPRHIEAGATTPSGSGDEAEVSAPEPAAAGEA